MVGAVFWFASQADSKKPPTQRDPRGGDQCRGRNSQTLPASGALAAIAALALCPIPAHAQKTAPKETGRRRAARPDRSVERRLARQGGRRPRPTLWAGTDTDHAQPADVAMLDPAKLSPASARARFAASSSRRARGPSRRRRPDPRTPAPHRTAAAKPNARSTCASVSPIRLGQGRRPSRQRLRTRRWPLADRLRPRSRQAADGSRWMPVRALCYALAGDFNAASAMIGEQTLNADGQADIWLIAALATIAQPAKTRPAGRYRPPFEAAVSVAAKLCRPQQRHARSAARHRRRRRPPRQRDAGTETRRPARRADGGKPDLAEVVAVLTAARTRTTRRPPSPTTARRSRLRTPRPTSSRWPSTPPPATTSSRRCESDRLSPSRSRTPIPRQISDSPRCARPAGDQGAAPHRATQPR